MTTQQQTQQMQQMQLQPPSDAARLFAVEKDVAGLKEGLATLGSNMDKGFTNLASEMKARSSINWAPVNIMLGVCTVAGGLFFTWVNSNTGRLEASIAKVETTAQRYVPREDLDARFAVLSQRRDDLQRLSDARVERVERDVDTAAKQIVPRAEHDAYRQLQQRDYDLLRNRVEKLEDRTLSRSEALSRNEAQDRVTSLLRGEVDEHIRAFNDRQQRRIDTLEAGPRR